MKLLITTQYRENYGDEDSPYWKFKGGDEFYVPVGSDVSKEKIESIVESLKNNEDVQWSNPFSEQYIIDYALVDDDFVTMYEQNQLEYEGMISDRVKTILV